MALPCGTWRKGVRGQPCNTYKPKLCGSPITFNSLIFENYRMHLNGFRFLYGTLCLGDLFWFDLCWWCVRLFRVICWKTAVGLGFESWVRGFPIEFIRSCIDAFNLSLVMQFWSGQRACGLHEKEMYPSRLDILQLTKIQTKKIKDSRDKGEINPHRLAGYNPSENSQKLTKNWMNSKKGTHLQQTSRCTKRNKPPTAMKPSCMIIIIVWCICRLCDIIIIYSSLYNRPKRTAPRALVRPATRKRITKAP